MDIDITTPLIREVKPIDGMQPLMINFKVGVIKLSLVGYIDITDNRTFIDSNHIDGDIEYELDVAVIDKQGEEYNYTIDKEKLQEYLD